MERKRLQKLVKEMYAKEDAEQQQETHEELERQERGAMYNILLLMVILQLESSSSLELKEGRMFELGIGATFQFVDDIQESMQPMLEYLKKDISSRRSRVVIGTSATMKEPLEISNSSDKKDEQKIGVA